MYEEAGDLLGQASVLVNLGIESYYAGEWDEALSLYSRSEELRRRAGDVVRAAFAMNNRAEILADQGYVDRAETVFTEAHRVSRAAGFPLGIGIATSNLARVAARSCRFIDAHSLYDEADALLGEVGAETYVIEARARRAECLVFEGRYADALPLLEELLAGADLSAVQRAMVERLLGYAKWQARRKDEARPHFDESMRIATEAGAEYELALTMKALADTCAPEFAGLAQVVFDRLGVVSTPHVPLP
jgi:tetratricopeptide (TPR) repeat protein